MRNRLISIKAFIAFILFSGFHCTYIGFKYIRKYPEYNERFCVAFNTIYIVHYTLQLKYFAKAWSAQTATLIVNVILPRRISEISVHLSLNCPNHQTWKDRTSWFPSNNEIHVKHDNNIVVSAIDSSKYRSC